MSDLTWAGVMPAITTPFLDDGSVDHAFLARHAQWMVEHGVTGMVPLGSLGEGATLEEHEKFAVLETLVEAVGSKIPIVPGISSLSTAGACRLARGAKERGCKGLMVLPPYVHKGPWAEMEAHFRTVFEATDLECMLYNNPIAYGLDVTPDRIAAFASHHENLKAVKESSGDVRRITAIRALIGDRLSLFAGLDDMIVEAIGMGAKGWVAGLVNALPRESVVLVERARAGDVEGALELYRWFLPLLRLDTVPEFVQLIKLVQAEVDMGSERLRAPRARAAGHQREEALRVIRAALADRPSV